MLNLTVENLNLEDKIVTRAEKKDVTFKSARLDKHFKNIHPRLRVDVAVFSNTLNLTYWFAGTKTYFRFRFSREFDNQLGIILYTTYKNIKANYVSGMYDYLLEDDFIEHAGFEMSAMATTEKAEE
jgi:hypothetical protein